MKKEGEGKEHIKKININNNKIKTKRRREGVREKRGEGGLCVTANEKKKEKKSFSTGLENSTLLFLYRFYIEITQLFHE